MQKKYLETTGHKETHEGPWAKNCLETTGHEVFQDSPFFKKKPLETTGQEFTHQGPEGGCRWCWAHLGLLGGIKKL